MRQTNRIEPNNTNLALAILITTTELEIIRRVEVTPVVRTTTTTSVVQSFKLSRKIVWCIVCSFLTVGILVLSMTILGFTFVFNKMNSFKQSNLERYDLANLQYGISNMKDPSNSFPLNINKELIEIYLSDQFKSEPGYLDLVIDEIFVENKLNKKRDISCSVILTFRNLQIYFEYCSTCINRRRSAIRHLFFNQTAFQQPLSLLFNNENFSLQICSIPSQISIVMPQQLNISSLSKQDTIKSTSISTQTTTESSRLTSTSTQSNSFIFLPFRPSKTNFP